MNIPWPKIYIYDHHRTAFQEYGYPGKLAPESTLHDMIHGANIILHNNLSGAGICWKYFGGHIHGQTCKKIIPELVRYVQDYDLWKYVYGDDTKYIQRYLRSLTMDLQVWDAAYKVMETEEGLASAIAAGKELQTEHDRQVDSYVEKARTITIARHFIGLAVECPPEFASDVGHKLVAKSGTYGCTFYPSATEEQEQGAYKYSLRSSGEYDVSRIAKFYGAAAIRMQQASITSQV